MEASYEMLNAKLEILLGEFSNHVFPRPVTLEEFQEYLKIKIDRRQFYQNKFYNEYGTEDTIVGVYTDLIDENYNKVVIEITLELDEKDRIVQIVEVGEYIIRK